jgi:hypothetical protein
VEGLAEDTKLASLLKFAPLPRPRVDVGRG